VTTHNASDNGWFMRLSRSAINLHGGRQVDEEEGFAVVCMQRPTNVEDLRTHPASSASNAMPKRRARRTSQRLTKVFPTENTCCHLFFLYSDTAI